MKKIIKNILSVIVLIVMIVAIYTILHMDILPNKYLFLFLGIEIILYLLGFFFYNRKNIFLIVLGILLFLLSLGVNGVVYYYFGKTSDYIDLAFNIKTYDVTTKYVLLTGVNNEVSSLDNLDNNTSILFYEYSRGVNLATKKLGNYNYQKTNDSYDSLVRTRNENLYFLISNSDYLFIMDASNELTSDQFKIIEEFEVVEKVPINQKNPDSYNIYINGLDYSGNRRDFNMIATINTKTNKIVLTSIPRDYYIYVPDYDMNDSLTALGTVDPEISKRALERLLNTKIDYVLNIYTESLVKVVDALGGVEFCSNSSFYTTHDMTLGSYEDNNRKLYVSKGCRQYNGLEALAIARERLHYSSGDRARQENCRKILISILKKMASTTTLTNYNEVLSSFDGLYTSNINKRVITNLVKSVLDNPNYDIIEQSLDGYDGKGIGRLGSGEVWAMRPNEKTVNSASVKINEVLNYN